MKVTISQKLRITQKKLFMRKMSVRSIPIYPANLATFEEKKIFGQGKYRFWSPAAPKREIM